MKEIFSFAIGLGVVMGAFAAFAGECKEIRIDGIPFDMPALKEFAYPQRSFCITDYGAKPDGTKCTEAIARAIAACNESGGGSVVVPQGTFLTGKVHLKSNVNLHLSSGAVLEFSDDPDDYMPPVISGYEGIECMNRSPLVYAHRCDNVAITGPGMLRSRIGFWLQWGGSRAVNALSRAAANQLTEWGDLGTDVSERRIAEMPGSRMRPQMLQFNRCRNVLLDGFKIKGTPWWTIHLFRSENVIARGLDVCCHSGDVHSDDYFSATYLNNSDGMDVEMSRNVLVEGCSFCQGDDAIVVKSGRGPDGYLRGMPSENIVVRDCEAKLGHGLVCLGSELSAGIRNVFVGRCRARKTNNLFFIKTNRYRGGFVENFYVDGIDAEMAVCLFKIATAYPASSLSPLSKKMAPTAIRNISISRIRIKEVSAACVDIAGDRDNPVENVKVRDIEVERLASGGDVVKAANAVNLDLSSIQIRSAAK